VGQVQDEESKGARKRGGMKGGREQGMNRAREDEKKGGREER